METIFRKIFVKDRLPLNDEIYYHTDIGFIDFDLKNGWQDCNKYPQYPTWWLEEIELPDGEAVANGCLEYLKSVGMVDGRHIIAHDWSNGVNWLHQYIIGEK